MAETLADVAAGKWKNSEPVKPEDDGEKSVTIKPEVGDVIIGLYVKSFQTKSQFSSDPGTGYELRNVKINDSFETIEKAVLYKKGNLGWMMSGVQEGDEVRIERNAGVKLDNGFVSSDWTVQHRPAQA